MSLRHRLDTQEGVNELTMQLKGERIDWVRRSPALRRTATVYLDTLTAEQRLRLEEIEKELLTMAYDADEEATVRTVLKSQRRDIDKFFSTPMPRIDPDIVKRLETTVADINDLASEANDQVPPEEEQ